MKDLNERNAPVLDGQVSKFGHRFQTLFGSKGGSLEIVETEKLARVNRKNPSQWLVAPQNRTFKVLQVERSELARKSTELQRKSRRIVVTICCDRNSNAKRSQTFPLVKLRNGFPCCGPSLAQGIVRKVSRPETIETTLVRR